MNGKICIIHVRNQIGKKINYFILFNFRRNIRTHTKFPILKFAKYIPHKLSEDYIFFAHNFWQSTTLKFKSEQNYSHELAIVTNALVQREKLFRNTCREK